MSTKMNDLIQKLLDIIVALDDGHGDYGVTSGKRTPVFPESSKYANQVMYENAFNKVVVAYLGEHLTRCGFKVLYTAPTDADTPLKQRTDLANNTIKNKYNRPADILISVHANALDGKWGSQNGTETLYTKASDKKLADIIHKHLMKGTPLRDRGVKYSSLHMCRESKMPACLVEACFMDNLKEAELLMSDAFRRECAEEIAKGVCEYFSVKYIDKVVDIPVSVNTQINEQPYVITKERISLSNGKLKFHSLGTDKGKATDVRHVFIKKENIDKIKLIYEKGKKVSQLLTSHKADLAINCTFYDMKTGIPSGHFKDSNLKTQSQAYGKTLKWKQFNINENKIEISDLDYKLNQACFQASPLIVENGKNVTAKYIKEHEIQSDIATGKSQRTFMGWDKDDNIHIFVADGRTDWDIGLEPKIMTQYCLHHKLITAGIFDGGGSSIIVDGKLGSLNQSANRGVNERTNHHALLFYFKELIKQEVNPIDNSNPKYKEVNIMIDNKLTNFKGYLVNGSTYAPLRSIGESLGATVTWDTVNQVASINGKKVTGILIDSRTYIPFRELGNLLNLTVDWDQNTFTAKYFTKK